MTASLLRRTKWLATRLLLGRRVAPPCPRWLAASGIQTFIDIGAHVGEYIDFARTTFPDVHVYAFEPLPDYAASLAQKYAGDARVHILDLALGEREDHPVMYRSGHAPSSSLLPMSAIHREAFPHSQDQAVCPVRLSTLDSALAGIELKPNVFIKIDTQGYEDRIIAGGKNVIAQASLIQIETSFEVLYEGQVLFDELYHQLRALGFAFHGVNNQIYSPVDDGILQAHAYFVRG